MSDDIALNRSEPCAVFDDRLPNSMGAVGAPQLQDISAIWAALMAGRAEITGQVSTHDQTGLEIADQPVASPERSLSAREREVVEHSLLSRSQKAAAIELHISQALLAGVLHTSFQKMGLECTYRNAPALLVFMVLALRRSDSPHGITIETFERDARTVHRLTVERPETRVSAMLSPAESAVVQMMVDGRSHEQMADVRRTSRRTIANQIAAIHAKLGVSGRIDLLARLTIGGAATRPANPALSRKLREQDRPLGRKGQSSTFGVNSLGVRRPRVESTSPESRP